MVVTRIDNVWRYTAHMTYMIQEEDRDDLLFATIPGCGPNTYHRLRSHFGTSTLMRKATRQQLAEVIGEKRASVVVNAISTHADKRVLFGLNQLQIGFVGYHNPLYPERLRELSDAPIGLFYKGNYDLLAKIEARRVLAVVGTRQVSGYGKQVTQQLVNDLARDGFVIVSGMARGVDAIAHQKALDVGGDTIGVLGCGVDVVYPQEHKALYQQIVAEGLLLSEFVPGQQPTPGLFVARNRIVSALCEAVLVVEGVSTSGAMITARLAAEQGREVMAIPGPITALYSEGPNTLIQHGAHMVLHTDDVRELYGVKRGIMHKAIPLQEQAIWQTLSPSEQKILELLLKEPYSVDELVEHICEEPATVLNTLSLLQLQGLVEKNEQSRYYLVVT